MNKYKFYFLIFSQSALISLFFISAPLYAEKLSEKIIETETNEWIRLQQETKELIDENNEQLLEDQVLANLLTIPYEKRQYFFPFIHEEIYLPHKIKSHPQILAWKGKKPTVIAPHLKEFAEKYLDDLPASFYYFLDPDYWVTPQPVENLYIPPLMAIKAEKSKAETPEEISTAQIRALKETYVLPPEIQKTFYQTNFTQKDITNLKKTLSNLNQFIDSYPPKGTMSDHLRSLIYPRITQAIASPFENWLISIKQTKIAPDFEKFIQSQGWKDSTDFAQKADTLLRAFRVNNLSIPQAMSISISRKNNPIQKGEPITSQQMYYLMHEAKPGDVLFVFPYLDELKKTFKGNNFIKMGLLIYID